VSGTVLEFPPLCGFSCQGLEYSGYLVHWSGCSFSSPVTHYIIHEALKVLLKLLTEGSTSIITLKAISMERILTISVPKDRHKINASVETSRLPGEGRDPGVSEDLDSCFRLASAGMTKMTFGEAPEFSCNTCFAITPNDHGHLTIESQSMLRVLE
jgi:hypothetical protein